MQDVILNSPVQKLYKRRVYVSNPALPMDIHVEFRIPRVLVGVHPTNANNNPAITVLYLEAIS